MSDSRVRVVVLLSGGMDSCVAAAMARRKGSIACLHCSYGQHSAGRERSAFEAVAKALGASEQRILDMMHLGSMGGSALTDRTIAVPAADPDRREIPATYVPFRNAQFLAAAIAWAEVLGATRVVYGAVEEDGSGYPDCRESFVRAFNHLIEVGTRAGAGLQLDAPLLHCSKAEIVRLGVEMGAPFHLTWSCYKDEDVACGNCDSCALRRKGFREAGVRDPLPYRNS
ncbi:MAG: 7-cyano-7-deazaguanine synthase QueC [Acidobacteria bacterium]|nr:7-cyano-7-deazaguanine synthase QueC [Acidobacteriota bacterium]